MSGIRERVSTANYELESCDTLTVAVSEQPRFANTRKKILAALIAGLTLPMAASAADTELLAKLEALSREIEILRAQIKESEEKLDNLATISEPAAASVTDLKRQVKNLEEESLSNWLSVGGEYQARVSSLRGETNPFIDVNATFANAQMSAMTTGSPALASLIGFDRGMRAATTFNDARNFIAGNGGMAGIMGFIGPYAAPVAAYEPENSSLFTHRVSLDLGIDVVQDVSFKAKFAMYKVFGSQSDAALSNAGAAPFFADRVGVFDGTVSHVPSDSRLNVDQVFVTWSNIADQDLWFSVGRRPSTGGSPSHLRTGDQAPGRGGVPSLLVDYAFDGMTIGYAPEIDALPGAFGKICYGVGFDSGFSRVGNSIEDTTMIGVTLVPIDTDPLRVWMQWNRGMDIFDAPEMRNTYFGDTAPSINLGDIDWLGLGVMSTFEQVGTGDLHLFADWSRSRTNPNNNVSAQFGFQGLLTGGFFQPEAPSNKTGTAIALGLRYDFPLRTKIGFEYNRGSKHWITFAPAADDMWTSKFGTRGDVYEAYLIHELNRTPIASRISSAFFRFGVKYYDFKYTGSNNWVGAPVAMSDANWLMMTTAPMKNAVDVFATFEVKF